MNKTTKWLNKQDFELSPKNQFLCYSHGKGSQLPTLQTQGTNIRLSTQHEFLALILDAPYLNWKAHIDNLITVCLETLNVLKALTSV